MDLLDARGLCVGAMFQDLLLQIEECLLVARLKYKLSTCQSKGGLAAIKDLMLCTKDNNNLYTGNCSYCQIERGLAKCPVFKANCSLLTVCTLLGVEEVNLLLGNIFYTCYKFLFLFFSISITIGVGSPMNNVRAPVLSAHLLSYLHARPPVVLGLNAVTVFTHLVVHHKLHNKHLLQHGAIQNLREEATQQKTRFTIVQL